MTQKQSVMRHYGAFSFGHPFIDPNQYLNRNRYGSPSIHLRDGFIEHRAS
jgi:hypothetical protein